MNASLPEYVLSQSVSVVEVTGSLTYNRTAAAAARLILSTNWLSDW